MRSFELPRVAARSVAVRGRFHQPRYRVVMMRDRKPFAVDWSRVACAVAVGLVIVLGVAL